MLMKSYQHHIYHDQSHYLMYYCNLQISSNYEVIFDLQLIIVTFINDI